MAKDETYYDDETMMKVAEALREYGIPIKDIPEVVSAMQNRGILFRERLPNG